MKKYITDNVSSASKEQEKGGKERKAEENGNPAVKLFTLPLKTKLFPEAPLSLPQSELG